MIEDLGWVPVDHLSQHPDNANSGDVDAIVESIRTNGFYSPLIVQRDTNVILAGNHRWLAAKRLNLVDVPVIYVDVDDAGAKRIMLADNRTNRLGRDDPALLYQNLAELYETDLGFAGTGFDYDDYMRLQEQIETPYAPSIEDVADEIEAAVEESEDSIAPDRKRLPFSLLPEADEDGNCEGVWVARIGYEPISKRDFNQLRVALGAMPLTDAELATYEIPKWGGTKGQ